MATTELTLEATWSDDAEFSARAVEPVHDAILATGVFAVASDTGQHDFLSPPSRSSWSYRMYETTDEFTKVYLKVAHTGPTPGVHRMSISMGLSTNGAGTLTGYHTGGTAPEQSQTSAPTVRNLWCAGDGSWMWLLTGDTDTTGKMAGFGFERSFKQDGTPTDDVAVLHLPVSSSQYDACRILMPVAAPAPFLWLPRNQRGFAFGSDVAMQSVGKWSSGDDFLTSPLFYPWHPHWMTSAMMRVGPAGTAELGDAAPVEHFGEDLAFKVFKTVNGPFAWTASSGNNDVVLLRWE